MLTQSFVGLTLSILSLVPGGGVSGCVCAWLLTGVKPQHLDRTKQPLYAQHFTNFAFKMLVSTFVLQDLCRGHAIASIKAIYNIQPLSNLF